jgi:hypothetical protein
MTPPATAVAIFGTTGIRWPDAASRSTVRPATTQSASARATIASPRTARTIGVKSSSSFHVR